MAESIQPVAGTLTAVVLRACQEQDCPHYLSRDCPEHAAQQDLGVVASFDYRREGKAQ